MLVSPFTTRDEFDSAVQTVRAAAAAYEGDGDILMDDVSYDLLVRRVAATEEAEGWSAEGVTSSVAAGANAKGTVSHTVPMLSLDNAMDDDEFVAFVERLARRLGCDEDLVFAVEPKLDGIALAARYLRGVLTQVLTRGDGENGEDVTANCIDVVGLPAKLSEPLTVEVRGECIVTHEQFVRANALRALHEPKKNPFANPRNTVAGTLSTVHRPYRVPLTFAAYGAVGNPNVDGVEHTAAMSWLSTAGFTTAAELAGTTGQFVGLDAARKAVALVEEQRALFGFDTDGAVIKADRPEDRDKAGAGSKAPNWAIARKFPPDTRITKLLDIKVEVGRTGRLSFTAELAPVAVGGVTVSAATLHNAELLLERDLRIGDEVVVRRAGEVIPEVVGRHGDHPEGSVAWTAPGTCPRCNGPLDKATKLWRCPDRSCGTLEALTHFVGREAMHIDGVSVALLKTLLDAGLIADFADLYDLTAAQIAELDGYGESSATKAVAAVQGSKTQPLSKLVTALGLRMTGRAMSKRLALHFGTLEALRAASFEDMQAVEGVGPERAASFVRELVELAPVIDKLVARGLTTIQQTPVEAGALPLTGMAICVTGAMTGPLVDYGRNEMNELIERNGGRAASSVSAKTSLLVASDTTSSKATKAQSLGVPIEDPEAFAKRLGLT